ncbi:MAG: redoxin domain-containing protein [Actinomycetota bacterium]|nr:redoxin domain-containing protein [Actinomycetota bacterium]
MTKLADREGTRDGVSAFGLPMVAGPVAVLLPLAELAVAAALLPAVSAWWASMAALGLLTAFILAISVNLLRGNRPACHCFGQLHSKPIGWPTLVRNGALAALAGFVLWHGPLDSGPHALAWLADLNGFQLAATLGGVLLLILVLFEGWLLVNLLKQNGRLLVRIDAMEERVGAVGSPLIEPQGLPGLPVGTPAPSFSLAGLHGETLTLDALRAAGCPVMLLFSDPNCGPCNALMPEITGWQREQAGKLRVALLNSGNADDIRAKASDHGLTDVLLDSDGHVAQTYQFGGTPSAVIVNPDGTIGSPLAAGADAIRALVARTKGEPTLLPLVAPAAHNGTGIHAASPRIGQQAPPVQLPDLQGKTVSLKRLRGKDTLVLFWNPGCGFCQEMLDDLKVWERSRPEDSPEIVLISTGTAEANRELGLKSLVLVDGGFTAGSAFGVNGTPMAVLVDADGRIASEGVAGAAAVMELAKGIPGQGRLAAGLN